MKYSHKFKYKREYHNKCHEFKLNEKKYKKRIFDTNNKKISNITKTLT